MPSPARHRQHLVTGATGFLGRHLVEALRAEAGTDAVVAMVSPRRTIAEERIFQRWRTAGVPLLECDLLGLPQRSPPLPACDVVYHLAGHTRTEAPSAEFRVNSEGTRNLLRWLGPALTGRQVIFAATLASVDHPGSGRPVDESTPCRPRTVYGRTKLVGEGHVRDLHRELGYTYTILRLCTIIGAGYRPTGMFGLLPRLLRRGAFSTRLDWPGRVSFLNISDLVRLLLAVRDHPGARNELFVVSNGENPTFDEVLDAMADVLGCPRRRLRLPRLLWRIVGWAAWGAVGFPALPYRGRIACWRLSHMIHDGLCADAAKLDAALGQRYGSFREGLRGIYAGGSSREAAAADPADAAATIRSTIS